MNIAIRSCATSTRRPYHNFGMAQLRAIATVVALVALQGVFVSRLLGTSLIHGSLQSRVLFIGLVSLISFFCVHFFYRPRIKSSSKKAVLVTGCDRGFGFALAKRLESQGFTVFAGCLNTESENVKQLQSESGLMHILQMDVTNNGQVQSCVGEVVEVLRREGKYLWAVVNNAGVGHLGFIEMQPMKNFENQLNVNTLGVVRVVKAFIPFLRGHGRIINVTSLASRLSYPYYSGYSMSKYATLAFSDCLRREMIPFKVKVVTVEPSRYRTEILSSSFHGEQFRKLWDSTSHHIRDQYGMEYYSECQKCLCSSLEDARSNIDEVLDVIEQAIWAIQPDKHYIPYLKTELIFRILSALPESMLDNIIVKSLLSKSTPPACACQNKQSSQEEKSKQGDTES